jgi:hypothetical protein
MPFVPTNTFEGRGRNTSASYRERAQYEVCGEAEGRIRDDPVDRVNLITNP